MGDLTKAEARWKQDKEDALREEKERASVEQRKAVAAVRAGYSLSVARDAELQMTNAQLCLPGRGCEGREEDKKQIANQEATIAELRWELQLRSRIIEGLRRELENQDKSLEVQGFAPPLPGRSATGQRAMSAGLSRSAQQSKSVGRAHSAERKGSASPGPLPVISSPRRFLDSHDQYTCGTFPLTSR